MLIDKCNAIVPGEWRQHGPRPDVATLDYRLDVNLWLDECSVSVSDDDDGWEVEILVRGERLDDTLLRAHRLALAAGIWPWPAPQVDGVRPAGWGDRPSEDEQAAHPGEWLHAGRDDRLLVCDGRRCLHVAHCAIDAEGRMCIVDVRGAR